MSGPVTITPPVVAAVKSASEAGYFSLEIIFKTPPGVATSSSPPPSSVTKEIEALRKYGETVYKARPGDRAAIKQCQCKVEIPAIKELYWFSANAGIGIPGIGSVGVSLASSETDDAAVVQAAGDSTWQGVHTKVLSLESSGGAPKVVFKVEK